MTEKRSKAKRSLSQGLLVNVCLFFFAPKNTKKCLQGSQMRDYICSLLCSLERKLKMWLASSRIDTAWPLHARHFFNLFKMETLFLRNELMSGCRKEKRKKRCVEKTVVLLWSTNSETFSQSLKKTEKASTAPLFQSGRVCSTSCLS